MSEHPNGYDSRGEDQALGRRIDEVRDTGDRLRAYVATVEGRNITATSELKQAVFALVQSVNSLAHSVTNRMDEWWRKDEAREARLNKYGSVVMDLRADTDILRARVESGTEATNRLDKAVGRIGKQNDQILKLLAKGNK